MNLKRSAGGFRPARLWPMLLMAIAAGRIAAAEINLMPRAFLANPVLDITAVTEMTDEGRKRPAPDKDHPVYFALVLRPMQEEGRIEAGIQAPPAVAIETALANALAGRGFVRGDDAHFPSLLIICDWGIYSRPGEVIDPDGNPGDNTEDGSIASLLNRAALNTEDGSRASLLNRAALVGGLEFSEQFNKALQQEYLLKLSMADQSIHKAMSPVQAFRRKNPVLFDRIDSEFYFIVATAFDFDSVQRREPVRLWRTKLTVDSSGVNLTQTLPALIASGAPYLGRETTEAVLLRQRVREGRVDLAPLKVLEDDVKLPTQTPEK